MQPCAAVREGVKGTAHVLWFPSSPNLAGSWLDIEASRLHPWAPLCVDQHLLHHETLSLCNNGPDPSNPDASAATTRRHLHAQLSSSPSLTSN